MNRPSFWFSEIFERRATGRASAVHMGLMRVICHSEVGTRGISRPSFRRVYVLSFPYGVLSDNPSRKKNVPCDKNIGPIKRRCMDNLKVPTESRRPGGVPLCLPLTSLPPALRTLCRCPIPGRHLGYRSESRTLRPQGLPVAVGQRVGVPGPA